MNCALTLNHTRSQWVDLGIHTEACMTQPHTCGAAGGAISVRINVIDCPSSCGGIVSSATTSLRKGSMVSCKFSLFKYDPKFIKEIS